MRPAEQLPAGLGDGADVVVVTGVDAAAVGTICRGCGRVPVLSVVPPDASASDVVEALRAGADACVRSEGPVLLGAHIRACYRRHQSGAALLPVAPVRDGGDRAAVPPSLTRSGAVA